MLTIIATIVLLAAVVYWFIEELVSYLSLPLIRVDPELGHLVYTSLPEVLISYLKLSLLGGATLALPVVVYQVWRYVAPGLHRWEKIMALQVAAWGFLLFVGGALFAYFVVVPELLRFLLWFAGEQINPHLKLSAYLNFVVRSVFAFGLAFELPFLMVMATRLRLVAPDYFVRYRAYSYLGVVLVVLLAMAGDPVATFMLAVPLFLLYETGIIIGKIFPPTIQD